MLKLSNSDMHEHNKVLKNQCKMYELQADELNKK